MSRIALFTLSLVVVVVPVGAVTPLPFDAGDLFEAGYSAPMSSVPGSSVGILDVTDGTVSGTSDVVDRSATAEERNASGNNRQMCPPDC